MGRITVIVFLCVLLVSPALAGEFSFFPEQDVWVNGGNEDANYGGGSYISVKDRSDLTEAYISFADTDLELLDGLEIGSASLFLYQYQGTYSPGDALTAHAVLEAWDEQTITWNSRPAYDQAGVVSQVFLEGVDLWREFSGMERYVQSWQEGDNFGLVLENHADGQKEELFSRFYSSDTANTQFKPYLKVTTTPEPVSMILFGIGGGVLAVASRLKKRRTGSFFP